MPPKRQQRQSKNPTKRLKTATAQPEEVSTPVNNVQIDYNKLAQAMMDISKQQPDNLYIEAEATTSGNQTPTTGDTASTSQRNVPAPTSSLGEILDQVFLGDQSSHKDFSPLSKTISLTDGIPLGSIVSQKTKTKIWNNEFVDFRSLLSVNFNRGDKCPTGSKI